MKESQKKRIREQSKKLKKKQKIESIKEKKIIQFEKKNSDNSEQWIERLDGFQHLNGCNININNNYINITTMQNKDAKKNVELYKDIGKNYKINKMNRLMDSRMSPDTMKTNSELTKGTWKFSQDEKKTKKERNIIKKSIHSYKQDIGCLLYTSPSPRD